MGFSDWIFKGKKAKTKTGKTVTLLNPSAKAGKFASELKYNNHYTNDGHLKKGKNGNTQLTDEQRAYRGGYLDARRDSAKAFKHNQKKGKN